MSDRRIATRIIMTTTDGQTEHPQSSLCAIALNVIFIAVAVLIANIVNGRTRREKEHIDTKPTERHYLPCCAPLSITITIAYFHSPARKEAGHGDALKGCK